MIIIGFMYILSHDKYYDYYRKGIKRIIPNSLIPITKPRIIEKIYDNNGELQGKVCGIFLKDYKDKQKDEIIDNIVLSIDKIKDEHVDSIVFEKIHILDYEDLKLIEKRVKLKVLDGIDAVIYFLPVVLKKIYNLLDGDLKAKEVLIIGENEDLTKRIIESIYKLIGFITITGRYDNKTADNIYKYVLDKTGLSIFYSKNIDRILTNYSVIINLIDNYNVDITKCRDEALIFDFSTYKNLKDNAFKSKKTVIDDFVFKINNLKLKDSYFLQDIVCSRIYEIVNRFKDDDLVGLYANNSIYSLEEFVNKKIKNKGKL